MTKIKNTKNKVFNLIISVICLILVLILLYLLLRPQNKVDQEFIDNYYSYLGSNDLSLCDGLYLYTEKEINRDLIPDTQKLCNAYLNLTEETKDIIVLDKVKNKNYCTIEKFKFATDDYNSQNCTITKIKAPDLNQKVKDIYALGVEKEQDFKIDDNEKCLYKNDYFYCGYSENFVYSLQEIPKIYRSVLKTVAIDDKIEIYDYFLKIYDKKCFNNYTTTEENLNCTKKYSRKEEINYSLLKKYGTLYKHTFQKDSSTNKYYWVSSEPLK